MNFVFISKSVYDLCIFLSCRNISECWVFAKQGFYVECLCKEIEISVCSDTQCLISVFNLVNEFNDSIVIRYISRVT